MSQRGDPEAEQPGAARWREALLAARLFIGHPRGTGLVVRAAAGPVRDRYLTLLAAEIARAGMGLTKIPAGVTEDRLLGGLDLAATLSAGRPIAERGLLAGADGGVLMLAMAERLPVSAAAQVAAALDAGLVRLERDGFGTVLPARFGVVALDEGVEDEALPAVLADRLAFRVDLDGVAWRDTSAFPLSPSRTALGEAISQPVLEALTAAALSLGIGSLRPVIAAVSVARQAAALESRTDVTADDATLAARLVFAHRATRLPAATKDEAEAEEPETPDATDENDRENSRSQGEAPKDLVLDAARAAIPPALLARLAAAASGKPPRAGERGRTGALQRGGRHGRPAGLRPGRPRGDARLDLLATLRAAAPWQRLRYRAAGLRIAVRPDDLRIRRTKQPRRTATIFGVDASGSSALGRLAEAKGAVEALLADCYVRRDEVALVAFRGRVAELLLPPTRSLARARRALAGLPGGGGTPLASGIELTAQVAQAVRRRGFTPLVVLLTDGQANVARDGEGGRARARADAESAAATLRAGGFGAILIDTSARPQPASRALADLAGAAYLALPHADAAALSGAVRVLASAA